MKSATFFQSLMGRLNIFMIGVITSRVVYVDFIVGTLQALLQPFQSLVASERSVISEASVEPRTAGCWQRRNLHISAEEEWE